MTEATIASKGQIAIPREVRDRLRLKAGHCVEFHFDSTGQVIFRPRTGGIRVEEAIERARADGERFYVTGLVLSELV
jgi:AbrB family looped-hinge helix DNA binding protein